MRVLSTFLLVLWGLTFALPANAAGYGSAYIPGWNKHSNNQTNVFISNVSEASVYVQVTFYHTDGTVYTEATEGSDTNFTFDGEFDASTNNPLSTLGSGATLAAGETGSINIQALGGVYWGYALIEWSATSSSPRLDKALVSRILEVHKGSTATGRSQFLVNGGLKF